MIFSFSEIPKEFVLESSEGVDVFCFFKISHAVRSPPSLWWDAVATSLKMKHEVVILSAAAENFPRWDERKRWDTGDGWLWIAPRGLSTLVKANINNLTSFADLKHYLTVHK